MEPAIVAHSTQIGLRQTGTSVTVPSAPLAKLMFYLRCMCQVLNLDHTENLARLTDFSLHYVLTNAEIDNVLFLCYHLSPDVLEGKCIFEDEEMCGNSQNQFFELSATQNRFLATNTILIGNQQRHVKKIMVYKPVFILDNYIQPMVYFRDRLNFLLQNSHENRGTGPGYQNQPGYSPMAIDYQPVVISQPAPYQTSVAIDSEKLHQKTCLNLCLTMFCPVWIFIWCCMCMCDV